MKNSDLLNLFKEFVNEYSVNKQIAELLFSALNSISPSVETGSKTIDAIISYISVNDIAESTANDLLEMTNSLFRYAENKNGIILPAVPSFKDINLSAAIDEDVICEEIMSALGGKRLCLWIALKTDIEKGELCALRVSDVLLRKRVFSINVRSVLRGGKIIEYTDKNIFRISISENEYNWIKSVLKTFEVKDAFIGNGQSDRCVNASTLNSEAEKLGAKLFIPGLNLNTLLEYKKPETYDVLGLFENSLDVSSKITEAEEPVVESYDDIPENELEERIKKLPAPELDHLMRCRLIANFVLVQFRTEEKFLDTGIDADLISRAVYYHDIGKTAIPVDDHYPIAHAGEKAKNAYQSHVEQGLSIISSLASRSLDDYPSESQVGLFRDVIKYHHERPDGKGFPFGKKREDIPFAGSLAAAADMIDNILFVGKTGEPDLQSAMQEISQTAGKRIDDSIAGIILDRWDTFSRYISVIYEYYSQKNADNVYGLQFEFHPFSREGKNLETIYEAELYINDPYYGTIKADPIMQAMEDSPKLYQFEKLEVEHLCMFMKELKMNGSKLPKVVIKVSVQMFKRFSFVQTFKQLMTDYGVPFNRIVIGLDEQDFMNSFENYSNAVADVRKIGCGFALTGFGGKATVLPSIGKISPDLIILSEEFGKQLPKDPGKWDMLLSIMQTTARYDIDVLIKSLNDEKMTAKVAKAGGSYINTGDENRLSENRLKQKFLL